MTTAAPPPGGTLDLGRAFTYVTEDPDWIGKVLVGGAFTLASILLVGIPFVLGYIARTFRSIAAGAERPLAAWDDLGGMFSEGFRLAVVYVVYALGASLLAAAPGCALMAPAMLASGSPRSEPMVAVLATAGTIAFYVLMLLVSAALLVWMPAVLARTALRGSISAGFEWQPAIAFIRANAGNYLLSLLLSLVAGFLAQFGVLLCCIGVFPLVFWGYLVLAYGIGETVRRSPVPVA